MTAKKARENAITAGLPAKTVDALIAAFGDERGAAILEDFAKQRQPGKLRKEFVQGDLLAAGKRAHQAGIEPDLILSITKALGASNVAVNLLNGLTRTRELVVDTAALVGHKDHSTTEVSAFWGLQKPNDNDGTRRVKIESKTFWGAGIAQVNAEIEAMAEALKMPAVAIDVLLRKLGNQETHALLAAMMTGSGAQLTFKPEITQL